MGFQGARKWLYKSWQGRQDSNLQPPVLELCAKTCKPFTKGFFGPQRPVFRALGEPYLQNSFAVLEGDGR